MRKWGVGIALFQVRLSCCLIGFGCLVKPVRELYCRIVIDRVRFELDAWESKTVLCLQAIAYLAWPVQLPRTTQVAE